MRLSRSSWKRDNFYQAKTITISIWLCWKYFNCFDCWECRHNSFAVPQTAALYAARNTQENVFELSEVWTRFAGAICHCYGMRCGGIMRCFMKILARTDRQLTFQRTRACIVQESDISKHHNHINICILWAQLKLQQLRIASLARVRALVTWL